MHYIQLKIIDSFIYAKSLRYSQARPAGIESNHYAYHLQQLLRDGFIKKSKNKDYSLAPHGLAYVERLSHETMKRRQQPVLYTAQYVTNSQQQTLCMKRAYQPFFGKVMMPFGKLHMDESLHEAAERELLEKTGISGCQLKHRGIVHYTIRSNDITISSMAIHVFSGSSEQAIHETSTRKGDRFWADASSLQNNQLFPGFRAIEKLLTNKEFFFEEQTFTLQD